MPLASRGTKRTGARQGRRAGATRVRSSRSAARLTPWLRVDLLRWLQGWLRRCLKREACAGAATGRGQQAGAQAASPQCTALPEPMLVLMQGQLASLLGHHPRARGALPHLALVERVLRSRGAVAVFALQDAVLERALEQLEALTDDWSHAGLAELRGRLVQAVRPQWAGPHEDNLLSTFGTPDKLQVSEVGLSVFEEVDASNR